MLRKNNTELYPKGQRVFFSHWLIVRRVLVDRQGSPRTPMQVHELLRTESCVGLLSVFMFTTARLWIFMRRLCSNFSVFGILRFLPDDTTTMCCIGVILISNAARDHATTSLCNPLFSAHTGPVMTIINNHPSLRRTWKRNSDTASR